MTSLEQTGVKDVYAKIATHFSDTRFNQWPWISEFIEEINNINSQSNVLDIGCGNGRNMDGFKEGTNVYGIDNCVEFIQICQDKGKNAIQADMACLPFADNYFNYLISIASFHHLSNRERRIEVLKEIHRVAESGAIMLISVWSLKQPPKTSQAKKITHYGDNLVKWNKLSEEFQRYYYIFKVDELTALFKETGWGIQRHFWDYGNEVFVLKAL